MGNVVATLEGDSDYSVAVAAHMDEIGFMVRHVTDEGSSQVDPLGGFDARVLRAQRVTVHHGGGSHRRHRLRPAAHAHGRAEGEG